VTVAGALAVYFVIWWTVLFAVLPFGVRSQAETGDITQGTEPGAPALPGLLRKALITTAIAAVVFVIVWYVWATFEL
jgi:predicted secreted protein